MIILDDIMRVIKKIMKQLTSSLIVHKNGITPEKMWREGVLGAPAINKIAIITEIIIL